MIYVTMVSAVGQQRIITAADVAKNYPCPKRRSISSKRKPGGIASSWWQRITDK